MRFNSEWGFTMQFYGREKLCGVQQLIKIVLKLDDMMQDKTMMI